MKKFNLVLGMAFVALFMMVVTPADAQSRRERKDARKEAKKLVKEGYQTMGLPVETQLANYYAKLQEVDEEGLPKYLSETGTAVGNTYNTAKMEATNAAKVRLAQQIQTMVLNESKLQLANMQLSAEEAASYSKALEKSTLLVAQKLNRVIYGQDLYRVKKNGNYEVRVVLLYNQKNLRDAMLQDARAELKKDLEDFTPQHEALLKSVIGGSLSACGDE